LGFGQRRGSVNLNIHKIGLLVDFKDSKIKYLDLAEEGSGNI